MVLLAARALRLAVLVGMALPGSAQAAPSPTFYRDVLPILQAHCQECHRRGEAAPMSLLTYKEVRPWAKAIRTQVATRKMPPWFADPCCGKFSNDRSLSQADRDTLATWAESGAVEGDPHDAPPPRKFIQNWNLPSPPDLVLKSKPFPVPAKGVLEYQYFTIPTGFTQDRWISAAEVRPADRSVIHHLVVYLREPGATWKPGDPTTADMLTVYTPGSSADVLPPGMAKLIKAGSELVLEIHFTPSGKATSGEVEVGLVFAKMPPKKRVLTLQMDSTSFVIPPGDSNYRVSVWGTLPNDALLLSFLPHMHLRGKAFEYLAFQPDGTPEVLLKVAPYDFYWQLSYRLTKPLLLKRGTRLEWDAWFDNSANNPRNPDPTAEVRYGHQSWQEMMVGFFDVAVDPDVDKAKFFVR